MGIIPKFKLPTGWLGWTLLVLGGIERLIGWGGSVDFILARWDEPAWVGSLMGGIVAYSNWIGLAFLIGGIVLLIRSERRRNDALYGLAQNQPANTGSALPPLVTPIHVDSEADARVQELQQQLDQERKKIGILAAAERAKEDLVRVEGMMRSGNETVEFSPKKVPPGMRQPYLLYHDQGQFVESVKLHAFTMWKDKEQYQDFISKKLEKKNPLDYVCEDHEKEIYGTNEGKSRYVGMKRHVQATIDYLANRRAMLLETIDQARML